MGNGVTPLVEMTGVSKSYGGVQACRAVDFTVYAGEVHALLGENGAGKSTLMKVLSGDVTDYQGTVAIDGRPVRFGAPVDAQRAGVAMIHQELDLVPALSVAENIFLGRELRTRFGSVDARRMNAETARLLERAGVELDPRAPVEQLRTGEQQLVTIAKALSLNARVLIMDEPSSALSTTEVDQMFAVIGELRAAGVGIVYISHRMDEIGRIADRATVLRNGALVAEFVAREMTATQAAEAMVGRPVQTMFRTEETSEPGEKLLEVVDLAVAGSSGSGRREPNGVSFTVRSGEIVGLAGLLGSGRTELLEMLFGVSPVKRWDGSILWKGEEIRPRRPRVSLARGIALVPEDRRIAGLSLEHSVLSNSVLSIVDRIAKLGFVARKREVAATNTIAERLRVKFGSVHAPVGSLSGGNQQKVVFGKVLLTEPHLLLLDEPTRGVDIGAKAEIYELLGRAAEQGIGVLMASSELAELMGVCDRVIVLRDGKAVRELNTREVGEADLLAASMGESAVESRLAGGASAAAQPNTTHIGMDQ